MSSAEKLADKRWGKLGADGFDWQHHKAHDDPPLRPVCGYREGLIEAIKAMREAFNHLADVNYARSAQRVSARRVLAKFLGAPDD